MNQKNKLDPLNSFLTQFSQLEINKHFKENVYQIVSLFKTFSGYTDNLQTKVDNLLHRQELEFFQAYKTHLTDITAMVKRLQQKIQQQQNKINYYENEGALSSMIKKSNKLEKDMIELYHKYQSKQKLLQSTRIQLQISHKQQQKLNQRIKQLLKLNKLTKVKDHNHQSLQQLSPQQSNDRTHNNQYISQGNLFPTEIQNRSIEKLTKPTIQSLPKLHSNSSEIQKFNNFDLDHQQLIKKRLQHQIHSLQKKNKSLLQFNVRAVDLHNELQNFFLNCIESMKKNICIRNKIKSCSFQEFKNEDKLNVLMMLLENDQIISTIYQMIFVKKNTERKSSIFNKLRQNSIYQQRTNRSKINKSYNSSIDKYSKQLKLPEIKSRRQKMYFSRQNPTLQMIQFAQQNHS